MTKPKIFHVDIDHTVLFSHVDERGNYKLNDVQPEKMLKMVKKINKLYDQGHTIIMVTGRHWNHLIDTKSHLDTIGIKYHTVTMGKPFAHYYIDDKGVTPEDFLELEI